MEKISFDPMIEVYYHDYHYGDKHFTIISQDYVREEDDIKKLGKIEIGELKKVLEFYKPNLQSFQKISSDNKLDNKYFVDAFIDGTHFQFALGTTDATSTEVKTQIEQFEKNLYSDLLKLEKFCKIDIDDIFLAIKCDIKELKPFTKFAFGEYFDKYLIINADEKFSLFEKLQTELKDYVRMDETEKDLFLGLPFVYHYFRKTDKDDEDWKNIIF
ncbi:MAG: hypothetical protein RR400_03425 [Clostridia bacterium]